ncbi:MAG: hypothetical protein ACLP6G_00445, partial [Terriglobales bacterium]
PQIPQIVADQSLSPQGAQRTQRKNPGHGFTRIKEDTAPQIPQIVADQSLSPQGAQRTQRKAANLAVRYNAR